MSIGTLEGGFLALQFAMLSISIRGKLYAEPVKVYWVDTVSVLRVPLSMAIGITDK